MDKFYLIDSLDKFIMSSMNVLFSILKSLEKKDRDTFVKMMTDYIDASENEDDVLQENIKHTMVDFLNLHHKVLIQKIFNVS